MNELSIIEKAPSLSKNSLIEFLRFIMAWSVLIFHGFMPFTAKFLDMGISCVSVDFFLLLGGFLFASTYQKIESFGFKKGFLTLLGRRIKRLGLPFLIALIFALYNTISMNHIGWLFGYLWFIPVEIIGQLIIYSLIKLLKSKKVLISVLFCFAILGYVYFYLMPPEYDFYPQGGYAIYFDNLWPILGYPLRGLGGVFIGYLLTFIPKIENPKLTTTLAIISFALVLGVSFMTFFPYKEPILLVLFALSIYFLFQINFSFPLFNFLGAISFGLYIFQTIGSTLRTQQNVSPDVVLMVIILISVLSQPQAFSDLLKFKKKKARESRLNN
ncbi:MAG: acyltransferase family protein [Acidaminococcaceae bacterium]